MPKLLSLSSAVRWCCALWPHHLVKFLSQSPSLIKDYRSDRYVFSQSSPIIMIMGWPWISKNQWWNQVPVQTVTFSPPVAIFSDIIFSIMFWLYLPLNSILIYQFKQISTVSWHKDHIIKLGSFVKINKSVLVFWIPFKILIFTLAWLH